MYGAFGPQGAEMDYDTHRQYRDKIQGNRMRRILRQLREDRIPLSMRVLGQEYERLTIVIDLATDNGDPRFLVDRPGGFEAALENSDKKMVLFEFVGKDRVPYLFKTTSAGFAREGVWMRFPEGIDRIQRRNHFRIPPPVGTRVLVSYTGLALEASVINISLGGALIRQNDRAKTKLQLALNDTLPRIKLMCQEKSLNMAMEIKKSVVRRVEKDSSTGKSRYALQFLDMGVKEKSLLEDWILRCQREFLRKRSFLED